MIDFFGKNSESSRNLQKGGAKTLLPDDSEDEFNPYTSDNHTLIPYLYLYKFFNDNIGFILMEPKTKELIAVDVGEFEASYKIVSELEQRHNT